MPTPSGFMFRAIHRVTPGQFEAASAALDRALLRKIGLPEEVEVRVFENTVVKLTEDIKVLAKDFSLSKLISILPSIVIDTTALWEQLKPKIAGKIERKEFITKVVRYVYRKNDPDLPFVGGFVEDMIEEAILNAVPDLLDNLEKKLEELIQNITSFIK